MGQDLSHGKNKKPSARTQHMNALIRWDKNRRRKRYYREHDLSVARTLIAYEGVFDEVLRDIFPTETPPRRLTIDFGWDLDLEGFDAFAVLTPYSWTRRIRFSFDFYSDIQSAANAIFRSRDFFPRIGTPNPDRPSLIEILAGEDPDEESDAPDDPLRREAAFVTAELAVAMAALHEIGHHVLGHVKMRRRYNLQIAESNANPFQLPPKLVPRFQASEIDADRFSFSRAMQLAAIGKPPFGKQLLTLEVRAHYLTLAVLANTILINLFHQSDCDFAFYERLPHPHPAVRLYAAQLYFVEALALFPENLITYQSALQECMRLTQANAAQQHTFSLFMNNRTLLCDTVTRLNNEISTYVRKHLKCYDFATDRWDFI